MGRVRSAPGGGWSGMGGLAAAKVLWPGEGIPFGELKQARVSGAQRRERGRRTAKLRLEWWWGVLVFILRALGSSEGLFSGEQGLICAPKRAIFLPMCITDWRGQERMWGADQLRWRCVPWGREHGVGGRVGWRGNEGKGNVSRDS